MRRWLYIPVDKRDRALFENFGGQLELTGRKGNISFRSK